LKVSGELTVARAVGSSDAALPLEPAGDFDLLADFDFFFGAAFGFGGAATFFGGAAAFIAGLAVFFLEAAFFFDLAMPHP
jgi:hypothetical protein